nr:glycosyltransferase [Mammaliicoccus sp. Marseille-Q6498]
MIRNITSTLPLVHGGRTKALLNRIKFFEESLNEYSVIHTTNYNPNYLSVYESFKERGIISENVKIYNIYNWLSGNKHLEPNTKDRFYNKSIKEPKVPYSYYDTKKNKNVKRFYVDGEYVLYRQYYKNTEVLNFEDFMSPISKKKLERREYNIRGRLHRIINFSPTSFGKLYEEYYDITGKIYLKKYFSDNKLTLIIFYKKGKPYKYFKTEKDMYHYYFDNVFEDSDIIFNDARLLDKPLIECIKSVRRVLVFHSTHSSGEKIRGSYKLALQSGDIIDKYIVLTDYQKKDIQKDFDLGSEQIEVIPHFVKSLNEHANEQEDKLDQFCYIGRISKEKQIDHLIKAFNIYLQKGFKTQLVIYGQDVDGEMDKLLRLVNDLDLKDSVIFKGYTNNPKEVFSKSKASLLTSEFEGFALTIMESINNGCPTISYNIKYGPSELIDNYKNGILVDKNNIEELANAMEYISSHGFNDVRLSNKFSTENAKENYSNLLNELKN